MPRDARQGRDWEKARAALFLTSDVCWLCGGHVDMALPYRDPLTRRVNTRCKSLDHVTPLDKGGSLLDPANHRLAHFGCNSARGARPRSVTTRPSRTW